MTAAATLDSARALVDEYTALEGRLADPDVLGDATALRLKDPRTGEPTGRGLGLTTDGNHRWCALDPRSGMAAVVAESVMNLATVGARPTSGCPS